MTGGEVSDREEEWSGGIHPDDKNRVFTALQAHFEGKTAAFSEEYRVRCKDGSWKWISDQGVAKRDAAGRVIRMAGSEVDITDRKQAEEQLMKTLESIGDGFFACDGDWRFIYINAPAERILGIRREEVLNKSHWDIFPFTLGTNLEREYRRAAAGEIRDFQNYYEPWDRWFYNRCFPREGGGMSVYFQDITEHKAAEQRVEQENREMMLVNRILRVFAEASDNELFGRILDIVQEGLASRHGVFGYISEPGHLTCPSLSRMLDQCEVADKCIHYPPEKWKGLWARALSEKLSLYTNEPSEVPSGHPAIRNNLAAPILFRGEVIGLLNLANKESDYTETDRGLLEAMAGRIAPLLYAWIQKKLREDERSKAEEALAASEKKYRELIETANSIIIRWDDKGIIRFINDYGLRFFGYSAEELFGRDVMTIVPELEESTGRDPGELVRDMVKHPENYTNVPSENIRKDGKTVWVVWTNKAILDEEANVQEILSIGNDITALKEAEAARRESEERLRFALESCNIGAWDLDLVDHTAFRSPEHDRIFGYEELLPQWTLDDFLRHAQPEHRCPVEAMVREATAAQTGWTYECPIRRVDGEIRWIWFSGRHRIDASGHARVVGVVQDITERKQAEERLKASLAEKEVLLKEIHHRVKNNMQVICSLVSLQADESKYAGMHSVLQDVSHRVRSMALVHEKLYQSTDLARVDFDQYAQSLLNYLWRAHGAAASGIRLITDLKPVSLSVNTSVPCGLILNELISNALKHAFSGRSGGEVIVSLDCDPKGRARLCVRDNGKGLPDGFDWKEVRSLGLRLVQMLAGQIYADVKISVSEGTAFTITFEEPRYEKKPLS